MQEKLSLLSQGYMHKLIFYIECIICANPYNHIANLDYMNSFTFKQISSWKELDDKMFAIVHLEKKGIEEPRDQMG